MFLKRVKGGRVEVMPDVGSTILGEAFEVPDELGKALLADKTGRFEKPTVKESAAAKKEAAKDEHAGEA